MHLNNDTTNYLPSNLKWGTNTENAAGRGPDRELTMADHYSRLKIEGRIKG